MSAGVKKDEQLMAVMAVLCGLHLIAGLMISAAGAVLGFALWRSHGWFTEPLHAMAEIYRDYLFAGFRFGGRI